MKGYSPKLPLMLDSEGGYSLTKTLKEVTKQNFKMLMLTSPGERIMEPLFGVGLYNYLFEMNDERVREQIMQRLSQQTRKYLPFIKIEEVNFSDPNAVDANENLLGITIKYSIPSLNERDILRIEA